MPAKAKQKEPPMTEAQLQEELVKANLRLAALKQQLAGRMEEVAAARAGEMELREKHSELEDAFKEMVNERFDIISDFTRQHKATEDELIARITILDSTITDLRDQKELSALALSETVKERDHYIALKQRECEDQDRKMREMEEEFAHMLSETQSRMTQRVEATLRSRVGGQGSDDDEEDDE